MPSSVCSIEEEAKIVREVFELYVNRLSASYIARRMIQKGYKTGTGRTDWSEKSVRAIIANEKYVGDCLLHKKFVTDPITKTKVVNRGEKDAYYVKDGHPGLISRELRDKACALKEERRTKMGTCKGAIKRAPTNYAGFGICPYCGKNYYVKTMSNAKTGIKKCLDCGSNRGLVVCRDSESIFLDDLNNIMIEQVHLLRLKPIEFKNELKRAFNFDKSSAESTIAKLNERIDYLKGKLTQLEGNNSESSILLKDEVQKELDKFMLEKDVAENRLLTCINADSEINKIYKCLNLVADNDISNTFRHLFKHVIVKNRLHLTFIIGREDMTGLNLLDLPECIKGTYEIKVRAQIYQVEFGIYINA